MNDPQALIPLFHEHVSDDAQRAIYRAIHTAYEAADEMARRELHEKFAPQAWGYFRWLKLDSELMSVGERFGNASVFEYNTPDTHIGHTELHFGRIMLTAACVPIKGRKPRPAAYRDMLAENNQLELFEQQRKRVPDCQIWAVVLHVPNVPARRPLHIHVGFISPDNQLAAQLIDLKSRVEQMADTQSSSPQVRPQLRKSSETGT